MWQQNREKLIKEGVSAKVARKIAGSCSSISDLKNYTMQDLLKINGIGETGAKELAQKLAEIGYPPFNKKSPAIPIKDIIKKWDVTNTGFKRWCRDNPEMVKQLWGRFSLAIEFCEEFEKTNHLYLSILLSENQLLDLKLAITRKYFTLLQHQKLLSYWLDGKTITEMSEALRHSKSWVREHLAIVLSEVLNELKTQCK